MKIGFKILLGLIALLFVIGVNANANRFRNGLMNDDTTKVTKEEPKIPESSIVDEVIWVVGDEPILKSEVEAVRLQGEAEGTKWKGDPDCAIPEQMAVQKLFLHQAAIDSIEVTESEISQDIEQQINYWIQLIGSKEKLEEYRKQTESFLLDQGMRFDCIIWNAPCGERILINDRKPSGLATAYAVNCIRDRFEGIEYYIDEAI